MPIGAIGKYERLDVLGHGASGVVYLAWDTLLRRHVALKEIRVAGPEMERVLEEARVLDRLRHPGIVEIHSVDQQRGTILIDMELVKGRNLADILRERGGTPLPLADALKIAQTVLDALGYAHERRVLHRDIKPANILIGDDGRVKLTDFGLAEALGSGSVVGGGGTYPYMAPEDFAEDAASDRRSDLWAVGVVLYETLTGRRPFLVPPGRAKDPFAWKRAIESDRPPSPTELRPDLPAALDAVLARALEKSKDARFPTANAFAEALREAAALPEDAPVSLAALGTSPEKAGAVDAPAVPFVFGSGQSASTLDELLLAAAKHWDESRQALSDGRFVRFLQAIGEVHIAEMAADLARRADLSPDRRLREFLERSQPDAPDRPPGDEEKTRAFLPRAVRLLGQVNAVEAIKEPDPPSVIDMDAPADTERRLRWWFPPALLLCLAPPAAVLANHPGMVAFQRGSGFLTSWTVTAVFAAMLALIGIILRQPTAMRALCLIPVGIGIVSGGALAANRLGPHPTREDLLPIALATLLPLGLLLIQAATARQLWRLWLGFILAGAFLAGAFFYVVMR